jgi:acyl-CoA 6-desaturase (Delta-6 desaturase)
MGDMAIGKGIDATDAFTNFHIRSKKAKKILEHLPSKAADKKAVDANYLPGQKSLLQDFHDFQAQLEKEGFFKPAPMHVAYRVFEIIALHAIGFYLIFHSQMLLGITILGIVSGRCGWLMHEGGHYSLTGVIPIDRALQIILYGVGCGMSASWWRNQHNKHHSMPQKLGHDVDLNTLPLVCFTEKVAKRIGLPLKLWIRMQAIMFPVITTLLVAIGWQFYLHPRHILRTKNLYEALSLAIRGVVFWMLFVPQFGITNSVYLYLAYTWIGANYIFLNFAVSHTHLPVVPKDDTQVREAASWTSFSELLTVCLIG